MNISAADPDTDALAPIHDIVAYHREEETGDQFLTVILTNGDVTDVDLADVFIFPAGADETAQSELLSRLVEDAIDEISANLWNSLAS
jgi:hypothetical protein